MNVFTATARVVADAELRTVGSGQVANVRLAVDAGFGDRRSTLWINGALWRAPEKLAPLLTKGRQIAVSGELSMREFTRSDGTLGQSLELRIAELDLLARPDAAAGVSMSPGSESVPAGALGDEIPF